MSIEHNTMTQFLLNRRSLVAKDMTEPGPNQEQLDAILRSAHRVPDHGKIGPWRFIIISGDSRKTVSEQFAKVLLNAEPETPEKLIAFEKLRLTRAPVVIAVISAPIVHPKVPEWEQVLSCGAVCQNILLAAHSLGFYAQWLTEWYSYDDKAKRILNITEEEKVAGFIYIGSSENPPNERTRPELDTRIEYLDH